MVSNDHPQAPPLEEDQAAHRKEAQGEEVTTLKSPFPEFNEYPESLPEPEVVWSDGMDGVFYDDHDHLPALRRIVGCLMIAFRNQLGAEKAASWYLAKGGSKRCDPYEMPFAEALAEVRAEGCKLVVLDDDLNVWRVYE